MSALPAALQYRWPGLPCVPVNKTRQAVFDPSHPPFPLHRELWRLLRPPSAPAAVSVEGAAEGAHKGEGPALGAQPLAGTSSQAELELTAGQGAREGEELVASRLEHALRVRPCCCLGCAVPVGNMLRSAVRRLVRVFHAASTCVARPCPATAPPPCAPLPQDLFPASFTQLVRVYNHQAVDKLLLQHDAASTQRDRTTNAVAALRLQLKDAEAAGGGDGAGPAKRRGGAGKAAARLARAEAQLAKEQEQVLQLEAEIEEARSKALSEPLGTAFFALFRWGAASTEIRRSLAVCSNGKAHC